MSGCNQCGGAIAPGRIVKESLKKGNAMSRDGAMSIATRKD
jgi:hypothetical protein